MLKTMKTKRRTVDSDEVKSKKPKLQKKELLEKYKIEEPEEEESDENVEDASSDELDNEDEDEDMLEESEGSDLEGAEPSTSSSTSREQRLEQRLEQKRQKKERKLKKAHGEAIEEIKIIWQDMRAKQGVSASQRQKGLQDIMRLVDGKWRDLVFRHDASRVVQTVFKYADKALRHEITISLKGNYVDLAKSAYGKYLLVKMMHYGNPQVRASIIDEMHGSFRRLMGHKEGAYVIEDIFRDYSTSKQRRQIMREFYGSEFALFKDAGESKNNLSEIIASHPDKKPYLMENLNKVITQAVNKGSIGFEIVHAMMLEYIRNLDRDAKSLERETFVDLIADDIVEMCHTNAGSQVASLTFAIATAKERKRLLKSVRQFPLKLAKDNYGNAVIMAAFLTVDDTKLMHKAFEELEQDNNMTEVICDKFARRPMLMLLTSIDNKKYFSGIQDRMKEVNEFKKLTSKKDDDVRQKEMLEFFKPAFDDALTNSIDELTASPLGLQFIGEYIQSGNCSDASLQAILDQFSMDPSEPDHILSSNPMSGRISKLMIRSNDLCKQQFNEIVLKYPVQWASGEGCFSVISLLETLDAKDAKKLKSELKGHLPVLKKNKAKGAQILLELLSA